MDGREAVLRQLAAVQLRVCALSHASPGFLGMPEELAAVDEALDLLAVHLQQMRRPFPNAEVVRIMSAGLLERVQHADRRVQHAEMLLIRQRSFRHTVPRGWLDPVALAGEFQRFDEAFPNVPPWPCYYHLDRRCETLRGVAQCRIHSAFGNWQYFAERNHVWKPCVVCLVAGDWGDVNAG